jgi:hypothetical protein
MFHAARQGWRDAVQNALNKMSHNGRQPTTLRPPIRANPSTRGFAGGRNVVERSERMRAKRNPRGALDLIILCRHKSEPYPG